MNEPSNQVPHASVIPDRLRSMEKHLEESAEVTRRLAHEFGNRMTVVLGFSELALQSSGSLVPTSGYIREVLESAYRTSNWLKRLHFFSRRKSQKELAPTSISGEVESYLETWKGAGVPLSIQVEPNLPPVACDQESFRELFHALLDNAIKACKGNGGAISVQLRGRTLGETERQQLLGFPAAGSFLEITVEDSGAGVAPELRDVLFAQPFFSGMPGQIGLGLAEVYGIVRRYHGGISWNFDVTKRTTFTILLPFSQNI